ncbi:CbiX/SirB N-terminal domain-containing protein [Sinomonas sp. ASV322]|uniref:sirohydrochlorin chelatase n=1 Tax=Sinomonas sp. ASV322 TaxID=3041920 RepID=UPI0027DC2659|nr:CbiX/SirB N-terminal domain-containing protein [Sinomonas sp. ASV322]MDQ4501682.1 CbiX/SirB N-terminal domain-containing protein [Sinomonas sp. ASV322]
MTQPILVACAHGTSNSEGKAAILRVVDGLRVARPEVTVLDAYVDVHGPELPNVVGGLPAGAPAVVVPLLLSVGYHVKVDIGRAVKSRERTTAAAPLGPDPRLARVLAERLAQAGLAAEDAVVLAAAGSSNPAAAEDVERLADMLRHLVPNRILAAYGASAEPSVPDAVAELRAEEVGRVVVASYLLAPGYFHDQLAKAGADVVAAPLLPAAEVAEIALERFDEALARL